jgi:TRAP-type C4-dicarboxylate transport system substrate-binding protein
MMYRKTWLTLLTLALLILFPAPAFTAIKIKFATVAPDGTTWMKTMREMDKELRKLTEGRVQFVFYPGGVAGDEKDILRKMRYGKIHATGMTGVGMGKIVPATRVLDLPFIFQDDAAVDRVHDGLFNRFHDAFAAKGYKLLGWAEVGFTYLYSTGNLADPANYNKLKMWTWEGDPVAVQTIQELGNAPIPLSLADVLTSLQTGLLDTVYCPPLAAMALQWHTKVDSMLDLPLVHASGALVLNKKNFDQLTPADQETLQKLSDKYTRKLALQLRKDNQTARQSILDQGLKCIVPSEALKAHLESAGKRVAQHFIGELYDADLLKQVHTLRNATE